jgi:2-polyprenyl-3-methyl-5-hydroxy-6-metoxy-1,4-benzoquinol methylase
MVPTDYDDIAEEYRTSKQAPWRLSIEAPASLALAGDVHGLSVLDLACGEGFYARRLASSGAVRVVGVDSSKAMVELAREAEGSPGSRDVGLTYRVGDVRDLDLGEQFDLVTAAYLLNYAADAANLLAMCESVVRHLRPGGRFVAINANPVIGDADHDYRILWVRAPASGRPGERCAAHLPQLPGRHLLRRRSLHSRRFGASASFGSEARHPRPRCWT